MESTRNPITYFDSPHGSRLCDCGSGEPVASGWFLAGHHRKALHARVAKIGTVRESINWFDNTYVEPTAEWPAQLAHRRAVIPLPLRPATRRWASGHLSPAERNAG
ncbi:hypothetical protein ACWCQ0_28305 [Streptomyces massasporeus]|uniref:Uncharacterized protein n=1 Tax=Streptomyces massasporeus TaxID=67324 RepID=A0ABW6LIH6_9ACTN